MNRRQQLAYLSPCVRAMDTLRRPFFAMKFRFSTILTVNK